MAFTLDDVACKSPRRRLPSRCSGLAARAAEPGRWAYEMASRWRHPKNDGWSDVVYDFGLPSPDGSALSAILNEACHVFRRHADGHWKSQYKDKYASLLAARIAAHRGLSHRLLRSGDRVISMLTHRALELLDRPEGDSAPNA